MDLVSGVLVLFVLLVLLAAAEISTAVSRRRTTAGGRAGRLPADQAVARSERLRP